jgi:lipopolysaccharide biosynthesis glycosyltransferase
MVAHDPNGNRDISSECRRFLRANFDKIVDVPMITFDTKMRSRKQAAIYGSWINSSFTKANIFNPEYFPPSEVDKVILLDADMMFLENCDELFELGAPALTFSNVWADTYCHVDNAVMEKIAKGERRSPIKNHYGEMSHGSVVSKEQVKEGFNTFVGLGCMMLIKPSYILAKTAEEILIEGPNQHMYGNKACASGPDEQLICQTLIECMQNDESFYHIHQQYNFIVGKHNWLLNGETPKTLQWYCEKPWTQGRSLAKKWPDLHNWYEIWDLVAQKHSSLLSWLGDKL